MARSEFRDLKGSLAKALGAAARAGAGLLGPVWAEAVGGLLAQHSRPIELAADGTLTVEVAPEFVIDLDRAQAQIRDRLNARLGRDRVRRLALRAAPIRP